MPIDRAHHALDDARALAGVFGALTDLRISRARKTSLTNLLDWLAIGLALDSAPSLPPLAAERELLQKTSRIFALGRYSDALERYTNERAALHDDTLPTVDDLIVALGGRALMERLRSERTAEQRYPEAVARLREIAESLRAGQLDETIDAFLERLTLTTSEGADVDQHRVNLLTLHSTKGLEFPCVYVVGVEDYQIPGYYPTVDKQSYPRDRGGASAVVRRHDPGGGSTDPNACGRAWGVEQRGEPLPRRDGTHPGTAKDRCTLMVDVSGMLS